MIRRFHSNVVLIHDAICKVRLNYSFANRVRNSAKVNFVCNDERFHMDISTVESFHIRFIKIDTFS